jgi:UDP-2-acetamido-2,6-beta-L-arabino-hexul-4-ose reductase
MKILVTGHTGFIGKNLLNKIKNKSDNKIIFGFDSSNDFNYLEKISRKIDTIVYLAGVQRPKNETDFNKINYDLLKNMFTQNEWPNLRKVIFSSSVHVDLHPYSIYSISKKKAEIFLMNYCESNSIYLKIYRFNNLFGPFGKVNYNSVVANFSYAISHDQAINISNPNQQITLNYISDAVEGIYNDIIDNKEVNEILQILEELEDEKLAVDLLKRFNEATRNLGVLVVNKDPRISHDEWKALCDNAQKEVDEIVEVIKSL